MSGFVVSVDLGNPGQLLACGGLLEAADRLWRESFVTGWFEDEQFRVNAPGGISDLLKWLGAASVTGVEGYSYAGPGDDAVVLKWPGGQRWCLNSWSGEDFGRTRIKTFAGQMKASVILAYLLDWARGYGLDAEHSDDTSLFNLAPTTIRASLFGLDARKGRAAVDVGFSPDALKINAENFPAVELFAAIGLQGFRPKEKSRSELLFGVWKQPLPVELARAAASCAFEPPDLRRFQFRLVGRKERSGVTGAPNDQYKTFTRAEEVVETRGYEDD